MTPMSALQQRVLAVLILLALIAVAVIGVAIPLRKAHAKYDNRLDEIVDKYAKRHAHERRQPLHAQK
jgi:hypothetical protein